MNADNYELAPGLSMSDRLAEQIVEDFAEQFGYAVRDDVLSEAQDALSNYSYGLMEGDQWVVHLDDGHAGPYWCCKRCETGRESEQALVDFREYLACERASR